MTAHGPLAAPSTASRLTVRDLLPLIGYVVPTVVTAYGVIMPRHGITGLNELTLGFASAVLGATMTYIVGVRAALARRSAQPHRRWRRPTWIAAQSAHPHGLVGWMLGHLMRRETAAANDLAIRLADITPGARVLDVGCGPGYAIAQIGRVPDAGRVVGLDRSTTMVAQAARRNRALIAEGRAEVIAASVDRVPFPDDSFDRVIAVHALYFWPDLTRAARELRRVLAPTGLLVIGLGDPAAMAEAFPSTVYALRSAEDVCASLRVAGFVEIASAPSAVRGLTLWWVVAGPDAPQRLERIADARSRP